MTATTSGAGDVTSPAAPRPRPASDAETDLEPSVRRPARHPTSFPSRCRATVADTDTDPTPFQQHVADGDVPHDVASSSTASTGSGGGDSGEIATGVAQHPTAQDVEGTTVHDLSAPASATAPTGWTGTTRTRPLPTAPGASRRGQQEENTMRITRKVVAIGTAGLLTAGGIGTAIAVPAAFAATSPATGTGDTPGAGRLQALQDALAGLVGDGTLTQDQADTVADTLESSDALGHGGHQGGRGIDLDAAATALGMTADDLRTALAVDGATLAGVAQDQGVERQALVDALVAAGTDRVQQAVTDGRLTQAEADERIAELPDRTATLVDADLPDGAGGRGGPGRGREGGSPADDDDAGAAATDAA